MVNEEKKIEKLLNLYEKSINTADKKLAESLYSTEEIMSPSVAAKVGVDNLLDFYERIASQNQINLDFIIEEIVIDEDMAYAVINSKGTYEFIFPGLESPGNRIIFLLKKTDREWKIVQHLSDDLDPKRPISSAK